MAAWGLGAQSGCSDRNGSHMGTSLLGCASCALRMAGGKLRKQEHGGGCSVGPGESDSILYIFAQFFVFLKNALVVTRCLFLECVCAAEHLPSPFSL